MASFFENALQRVSEIGEIVQDSNVDDVNFYLAREYFRRLGVMLNEITDANQLSSLFQASSIIKSELPDTYLEQLSKIKSSLREERKYNAYVVSLLIDYLKWSLYIDLGNPISIGYPDIYEPIFKVLEKGHAIGRYKGEFMIGDFSIGRIDLEEARQREIYYFEE